MRGRDEPKSPNVSGVKAWTRLTDASSTAAGTPKGSHSNLGSSVSASHAPRSFNRRKTRADPAASGEAMPCPNTGADGTVHYAKRCVAASHDGLHPCWAHDREEMRALVEIMMRLDAERVASSAPPPCTNSIALLEALYGPDLSRRKAANRAPMRGASSATCSRATGASRSAAIHAGAGRADAHDAERPTHRRGRIKSSRAPCRPPRAVFEEWRGAMARVGVPGRDPIGSPPRKKPLALRPAAPFSRTAPGREIRPRSRRSSRGGGP